MVSALSFLLFAFLTFVSSQQCPRCTPLCQNGDGSSKVCGSDGCGGSCGSCSAGQQCCRGLCACAPNCVGKSCGDDGCGYSSCGSCASTQTCSNGQCVGTATPSCAGRLCGSDRAGGSCGSCSMGQRCRAGQCQCYYDCNDRNCGTAVQDAGANTALCPQVSCGTCPSGFSCSSSGLCSALVPCVVVVSVSNCANNQPLGTSSTVMITGSNSYSFSLNVASTGSANWTTPGTGTFNFTASAAGFVTASQTMSVTVSTTTISLCLFPATLQVDIRNSVTNKSITVGASVTWTGLSSGSFTWNGITNWTSSGFGTYTFIATPFSGYAVGNVTVTVSPSTSLIIIYVNPNQVTVVVNICGSSQSLGVQSVVQISSTSPSYSFSLSVGSSGSALWTMPGAGTYTFTTSANGFNSSSVSQTVSVGTSVINLCLNLLVQVDIRNRATNTSITVPATVTYNGQASGTFSWNGLYTLVITALGNYNFIATPSSQYGTGSLSVTISSSSSMIIIYVDTNTVQVDLRDNTTGLSIAVSALVTYTGQASGSFTWSKLMTWSHGGFGTYTFTVVPSQIYANASLTTTITASTTIIIIYLGPLCGDHICEPSAGENNVNCEIDCANLILDFENADGTGPVNGIGVNFFMTDPRTYSNSTGPNRNNAVTPNSVKQSGAGSNVISQGIYGYNQVVYIETNITGYINFYWTCLLSIVNPSLGSFWLRAHLARLFLVSNLDYRFVNTWRPDSQPPAPYGPTNLILTLFHPQGALDVNHPTLTSPSGSIIGQWIATSKTSGGPATLNMSPGSGQMVAVWNIEPPRDPNIAPNQQGRYIVNSDSYVVVYGKTSNAGSGKQLGQVTLYDYLTMHPSSWNDTTSNLWYAMQMTPVTEAQNQPTITAMNQLGVGTIDATKTLTFNCTVYSYCYNYAIPFSDGSRRKNTHQTGVHDIST